MELLPSSKQLACIYLGTLIFPRGRDFTKLDSKLVCATISSHKRAREGPAFKTYICGNRNLFF